jgi:hypothetical protein
MVMVCQRKMLRGKMPRGQAAMASLSNPEIRIGFQERALRLRECIPPNRWSFKRFERARL